MSGSTPKNIHQEALRGIAKVSARILLTQLPSRSAQFSAIPRRRLAHPGRFSQLLHDSRMHPLHEAVFRLSSRARPCAAAAPSEASTTPVGEDSHLQIPKSQC